MKLLDEQQEADARIMRLGLKTVTLYHITYVLEGITILVNRKTKKIIKRIDNMEVLNGNYSKRNFTYCPYGRIKSV